MLGYGCFRIWILGYGSTEIGMFGIPRLSPSSLRDSPIYPNSLRLIESFVSIVSQDESACQQFLQQQAVLDKIAKGIPVPLPNAGEFMVEYFRSIHNRLLVHP